MPIIKVKVSGEKSHVLIDAIGALLMDCTSRILNKKKDVTAITIEFVSHDSWFVGGRLLSETGRNSFTMDIKNGKEPRGRQRFFS